MREKIIFNDMSNYTSIEEAFEMFTIKNKARNLASETIKFYELRYKLFIKFLKSIGYDKTDNCKIITESIYSKFSNYLFDKNIKPVSVANLLRGINTFLRFSMKKGYMQPFDIEKIHYEEEIKENYTDDEIIALTQKPNFSKKINFPEARNWVITLFLVAVSPRSKTIRNMKINQLDFENKRIKLEKLKGKKAYYVPLCPALEDVLVWYLKIRGGDENDILFCTKDETKFTRDGFRSAIKRYNISRGVYKTSPHLYRHTVADNWLRDGGSIEELSRLLGHSSITITEGYARKINAVNKEKYLEFNLLDKIVSKKLSTQKYDTIESETPKKISPVIPAYK